MKSLLILIFVLFLNLLVALISFADSLSPSKLLLKKVEIDFEPSKVFLLEEFSGNRLGSKELLFKVLKNKNQEIENKYIITVAGLPSNEAKPISILLESSKPNQRILEAASSLIENSDFVEPSEIDQIRARILDLRSQSVALEKDLSAKQVQVEDLQAKAASLARLNRLVEAQNTVASLSRKLEGLESDKSNIKLLLDIVKQEQSSARLASSEGAISRDLRLLSQEGAGAKRRNKLLLNDSQREAAEKTIEKARGLNLESLREKAQIYNAKQYPAQGIGTEDSKGLADEYNTKHNL